MKNTLFVELLSIWNKLSKKEKLKYLQKFEAMNASFANREEREIVLGRLSKTGIANTSAIYSSENPSIITLNSNFMNFSAIENISTIFHEGFHASVDDFFKQKTDLRTYSPIDEQRLREEYSLKDIIYNRAQFEKLILSFTLGFYEENIVKYETCLYLISNILKTCETLDDCQSFFGIYYADVLGDLFNYTQYKNTIDNLSHYTYNQILSIARNIDSAIFSDKILDASTNKKIISQIDPIALENFDKNFKLFIEIQKHPHNKNFVDMIVSQMIENLHKDCLLKY